MLITSLSRINILCRCANECSEFSLLFILHSDSTRNSTTAYTTTHGRSNRTLIWTAHRINETF